MITKITFGKIVKGGELKGLLHIRTLWYQFRLLFDMH
jgi:hypothetical protein